MPIDATLSRRSALAAIAASAAFTFAPPALAVSKSSAENLVGSIAGDVITTINKGGPQSAMFREFENIFARYADVEIIAKKALGPTWRAASGAQRKAYVAAFRGYMARTYGKRFNEFRGATINVTGSKPVKGGYLVDSKVNVKGRGPITTQWHVVDAKGKPLMYNMYIEGVSVLTDVRTQVGSMLDKRGGSIDKLTQHLKTAG